MNQGVQRSMTIRESLIREIANERARRETGARAAVASSLEAGRYREVLEGLIFFTAPGEFESLLGHALGSVADAFGDADLERRSRLLGLLVDLAIGLRSFLPRWNLRNRDQHAGDALGDGVLERLGAEVLRQAIELSAASPEATAALLDRRRASTAARFAAEQAADPDGEALRFVGASTTEYARNLTRAVLSSNLRRIAEMRDAGQTLTEISNDYAAFLPYALLVGASFATTNPPLVDYAWLADRERWDAVADGIIGANRDAGPDELARLMTAEVVLANMRLLRPIFLLTGGAMGCVCLQVNPHNHDDSEAMTRDATFFYGLLRQKLDGGVPNVVFKLPGTQGGLEACRALTAQGIGVTITVNFGLFQHLPFAEAMAQGEALFSCLVEMNGRLAYPVRDELLGRLPELAEHGIDEGLAREAAAWAGVAPIKRVYGLLRENGYDLRRYKPLIASLRIYEGGPYENLPSAFPDMTEILGATLLSVFPNVRRAFDAVADLDLAPTQIEMPVPSHLLAVLQHSEIFKQAYYVADRGWVPDEDERFRPSHELRLDQRADVFDWPPVYNTMTQFQNAYDAFVERILARRSSLQA
jgi:transaldolase